MARRFETFYRVKTRDNLGDPEYWNRRFEDVDRRVSGNEDALSDIGGLAAQVEGLALDRLNLVLAPAFDKINQVAEAGFLLARSSTEVTLTNGATVTFVIDDEAEREVFSPSVFLAITREANLTDYAFARRISYSQVTGELVVEIEQAYGNPVPFTDWEISVGAGVSNAISVMLADTIAARDTAIANATTSTSDRTSAQVAKTAAETARTGAESALTSFNTIYHGVRSDPPASGLVGSFYYDSDEQVFKVLGSLGWAPGHAISFGGVVSQDYTVTDPSGQTVFLVDGGFDKVEVIVDGTQLSPLTDFVADITARTITLTTAAPNGAWVGVRGYKASNSTDFYTKSAADTLYNTKLDKTGGSLSGALSISGTVTASDLKSTTGVVRLNATGDKYLQWTGSIYTLAGAGGIWHTGNFDPTTKLDRAGGSITGGLTVSNTLNAGSVQVNGQNVWHAGNFDPNLKLPITGGSLSGDLTVYRAGASNTGVVFLGSGTGRGLFWDGSNYSFLGSGVPWHTGNFDPNTKANLASANFGGPVELTFAAPHVWLHYPGVKRARWVVDGGGTLIWQDQGGTNHFFIDNVGHVWTQQYGWMHDYIWNVANERGLAWRNDALANCVRSMRLAYITDTSGLEPWGGAVLTGLTYSTATVVAYNQFGQQFATGAVTGITARYRWMQMLINGGWYTVGLA